MISGQPPQRSPLSPQGSPSSLARLAAGTPRHRWLLGAGVSRWEATWVSFSTSSHKTSIPVLPGMWAPFLEGLCPRPGVSAEVAVFGLRARPRCGTRSHVLPKHDGWLAPSLSSWQVSPPSGQPAPHWLPRCRPSAARQASQHWRDSPAGGEGEGAHRLPGYLDCRGPVGRHRCWGPCDISLVPSLPLQGQVLLACPKLQPKCDRFSIHDSISPHEDA